MNATAIAVLGVVGALLGGGGAVLGILYTRARNSRDDLKAEVKAQDEARAEREATHALAQSAYALADATRIKADGLQQGATVQDSRVAVLESKMDVFWKNVALDMSHILHSPHPGWEDLDALLERYRAHLKNPEIQFRDEELAELAYQLREMVEGRWPTKVSRADQAVASLMLRAIEQTRV